MTDPIPRLNAALEGRYRIERELGAGGMATVYLADDLRHERRVALKVLKPELAAVVGAERFLAEIKTTANLQHPHILPLHDSGEADGFLFYVMPYVEGETLRDKIDQEKQLSVGDAVKITERVALALDYAHKQGVVHRDIKPGNILLSADGEPTVADFGIALAVAQAGGGRVTETGLSMGTPHYMSPEQATGDRDVDPRTDIYALGCVLYEMLTGDPPYGGSTAQAVLAKILTDPAPTPTRVRVSIPANVDAAIRKALEKLPADRFASAREFAEALADPGFRHGADVAAGVSGGSGLLRGWALAATAAALAFALVAAWALLRPGPPTPVTRVSVQIPQGQAFFPPSGVLDLSPDGSLMVYQSVASSGSGPQLWARRWDALDAIPIRGTENAGNSVAISPDGQEVAFQVGSSLRVVPIQGGVSRTLAEATSLCCPGWSPDGAWVYYSEPTSGLRRVPSIGGAAEVVTEVEVAAGDITNVLLNVLPGGRGVVFMTRGAGGDRIQVVDVETGGVKDLTPGSNPRYSPTGHLLFIDDDGTLLAAPFDLESLALAGAPVPVAEGLRVLQNGTGFFAVSQTGTLVYRTGAAGNSVTPVWVDRDGTAREIDPGWSSIALSGNSGPRLSPDGTRLAVSILDAEGREDVWVKELETGPASRLTFEGAQNTRPTWSPDGQSLLFQSSRAGNLDVWTKRADGSDTPELVLDREAPLQEAMFSPDGTWLVFREGANQDADIYALRVAADSAVVPLEVTEFQEAAPALSPDGLWLAYTSNRSGRAEVFVRPFPEAGTSLRQVSANGGTSPVWAHNGRELFYVNGLNEMVVVQVSTDPAFAAGRQEVLFDAGDYLGIPVYRMYDVTPDDQRFVMFRNSNAETGGGELILVENWAEEFARQVGGR